MKKELYNKIEPFYKRFRLHKWSLKTDRFDNIFGNMLKKKNHLSIGFALAVSVLAIKANANPENAHQGISGYYGNGMTVAVDRQNQTITGHYENYTGWDEQTQSPRFSCIFYFSGTLKSDSYQIRSWHPDDQNIVNGKLTFQTQNKPIKFNLKLDNEHEGCWNVQHFAGDSGANFELSQKRNWVKLAIIFSPKAVVYNTPNLNSKQDLFISQGDIVKVISITDDWVEIEWGKDIPFKGWLQKSDLKIDSL